MVGFVVRHGEETRADANAVLQGDAVPCAQQHGSLLCLALPT